MFSSVLHGFHFATPEHSPIQSKSSNQIVFRVLFLNIEMVNDQVGLLMGEASNVKKYEIITFP